MRSYLECTIKVFSTLIVFWASAIVNCQGQQAKYELLFETDLSDGSDTLIRPHFDIFSLEIYGIETRIGAKSIDQLTFSACTRAHIWEPEGGYRFQAAGRDQYVFSYQDLKINEQIRLPGGVYTLTAINVPKLHMVRDDTVKPVAAETYCFPFRDDGTCSLGLRGLEITDVGKHEPNSPTVSATVKVGEYPEPDNIQRSDGLGPQKVQAGKILWIGNKGYLVTQIVLADRKKNRRGWLEIEIKPKEGFKEEEIKELTPK
jgi:hypothetical protein